MKGTILASALTGGLAGTALTLVVNWIKGLWQRPRIRVLFDNEEPGCLIVTNAVLSYVRLKIKNAGKSTAHDVSVCATKLTFTAPGAGSRTFEEDVLDLKVANGRLSPFMLAPGAHRYIDLAVVHKGNLPFSWVFEAIPVRLLEHGFGARPGSFGAKIFVFAENAKAERRIVTWSWNGNFPGLDITGNRSAPP